MKNVGWAWTVNPSVSQKYMAELVQNLMYNKTLKRGRTVAEAYEKLRFDHKNDDASVQLTLSLIKIYGATNNIVDLRRDK